jgi:hypothetical protein
MTPAMAILQIDVFMTDSLIAKPTDFAREMQAKNTPKTNFLKFNHLAPA